MREILFRGKRVDNGEWVDGFYVCCRRHHYILPVNDYEHSHGFDDRYDEWLEIDISTLCQYTGLNDKNKQEIWENDIIEVDFFGVNIYGVIKFGKYQSFFDSRITEHCGFYAEFTEKIFRQDLGYWVNAVGVKVIGNVFDNPELLK